MKSYAAANDLPYRRLVRAYNGGKDKSTRAGTNLLLTKIHNDALLEFCDSIDAMGMGVHKGLVEGEANHLLREAHDSEGKPPQCGRHWASRWLSRQKQYAQVRAKPLDALHSSAYSQEGIRKWFDKLKAEIDNLGIQPSDMWNMDETGCRIGIGNNQRVFS